VLLEFVEFVGLLINSAVLSYDDVINDRRDVLDSGAGVEGRVLAYRAVIVPRAALAAAECRIVLVSCRPRVTVFRLDGARILSVWILRTVY